jgi:hypothetical protein
MAGQIVRVLIGCSESNEIFTQDCVSIEDELWLVANWLQSPDGKWLAPNGAIRVDSLGVQENPGGHGGAEFLLQSPVSKAVMSGDLHAAEAEGLPVLSGAVDRLAVQRGALN